MEVKYRQPVPTETKLQIIGRIVRLRGRIGKAVGEIRLPDNSIVAEAELTIVDVPPDMVAGVDVAALGWCVDPDY